MPPLPAIRPQPAPTNRRLARVLSALERVIGGQLVWKTETGSAVPGLNANRYCNHRHPYCIAVKRTQALMARCMHDDVTSVARGAYRGPSPCVKTCHAGIAEIVIPLWGRAGYAGVLCWGPFRDPLRQCPIPRLEGAFRAVEVFPVQRASHVKTVLSEIGEAIVQIHAQQHDRAPVVSDARVKDTTEHIASHCCERLSIPDLASRVHMSASRLQHLYKKGTGHTIKETIRAARMAKARALIEHGDLKLLHIASLCGFDDYAYFSAHFRAVVGTSPAAYRRNCAVARSI